MPDQCVHDVTGGHADLKRTHAVQAGLDFDLYRVRCLKLQVVEPLGNEAIGGKIPGRQPGSQPSADRVLKVKAATRP